MATSIMSPVSLTSYFDNATGEAKQANLFFYKGQTLDPITVYTDSLLRIPHPSPVVTTGFGRVPPVYVGEIAEGYRVRTFDQYQVLIEDIDQLPGAPPAVEAGGGEGTVVEPGQLAQVGEMRPFWSNHQAIAGWIECDGRTIGDAASNATAWQSEDARRLFYWLWQNDKVGEPGTPDESRYSVLTVVGGKGSTAEGDFDGHKQIYLPDTRGRLIGGMDGKMTDTGGVVISTTGRLDKGLFSNIMDLNTGAPGPGSVSVPILPERINKSYDLGAYGGEDVHQLKVTELAVHLHDWWDQTGHTHYIYDTAGHSHTGIFASHTHNIGMPDGTPCDTTYGLVKVDGFTVVGYAGRALVASSHTAVNRDTGGASANTLSINAVSLSGTLAPMHALWNVTPPNYGSVPAGASPWAMYIGTYVPAVAGPPAIPWHYSNPTRNNPPNAADGALEADRGDKPHNTMPPFLLVCWYIKS